MPRVSNTKKRRTLKTETIQARNVKHCKTIKHVWISKKLKDHGNIRFSLPPPKKKNDSGRFPHYNPQTDVLEVSVPPCVTSVKTTWLSMRLSQLERRVRWESGGLEEVLKWGASEVFVLVVFVFLFVFVWVFLFVQLFGVLVTSVLHFGVFLWCLCCVCLSVRYSICHWYSFCCVWHLTYYIFWCFWDLVCRIWSSTAVRLCYGLIAPVCAVYSL